MIPVFVLTWGEGPTMTLDAEDEASGDWFLDRPVLISAVRAFSSLYAGKKIDECRALVVALELEETFRRLTGAEVRVRAMKWTPWRTTSVNGREFVEQVLHEIAN